MSALRVAVPAVGVTLLVLPGVTHRLVRRLPPGEWARLNALALLGGFVIVELVAGFYGVLTIVGVTGIPGLAELCGRMLARLGPGGPVLGWIAATVAVAIPVRAVWGWRAVQRARRSVDEAASIGTPACHRGVEMVVLPVGAIVALGTASPTPRIVVSRGIVDLLDDEQLAAVARHEQAHIILGHERFLLLAAILDHVFGPLTRRGTMSLRMAVERWADEHASAGLVDGRRQVRSALLRVGGAMAVEPGLAAFSNADSLIERIDSLDTPRPPLPFAARALLYGPAAGMAAASIAGAVSWANGVHNVIAMAGRCAW